MRQELKAFVEKVGEKMLAIASTDTPDRMGDSLDQSRWDLKQFKKNPVLIAGHDYAPEKVIGVARNIKIEDNKLIFEPDFHELTQLARDLGAMVREGILKAFSVGFIPNAMWNPDDKSAKNELLEISLVSVPANAEALMIDAKGYCDEVKCKITDWVAKSVKDEAEEKKKPKTKSPKCRMTDETFDDCLARKIPEIMDEDDSIDQDQAVAIASKYCKKPCDEEPDEEEGKSIKVEEKEGRVLSKKNKEKIQSAVDITKQAVAALEELLELTQEEKPKDAVEEPKVEKTKAVKKTFDEGQMVTQILRRTAGNINLALKRINESKSR